MRTLFKGGSVVSGSGAKRADLVIENEKVTDLGRNLKGDFDRVVDVTGCLLFPGFIDAHTHFDLDVCNTTTADDFYTGSRAALRGGTTTIIDFACPNKGESLHYGLDLWHKKADGRTFCDYGFHMTIDDWNESIRAELPDMFARGVSSFKMYMTYPAMMVGDRDMYWALKELKTLGGICGVHCENAGVIDGMIAERKNAGQLSPACHPLTRPPYLEAEAVSRLLRIAQAAEAPVVIVHLTNQEALNEVRHARDRGQKVFVETCPQYLLLDDSVYFNEDYSQAARYVCAPPIREKGQQEALWKALRRGDIQTISTDHCSFTLTQKDMGQEDFTKIPGGLPGVETRGELIYSYGVAKKRVSLGRMVRALSENPAKLYGLFPRKGQLRLGSDADIVVYDPGASHVIRADDYVANVDYNPYEGFVTVGGIRQVWLRGSLAVEDGRVLDETPQGRYMARGKCSL
ncbi:dihydropyrimidinase [uncultured Dysosmobacter sp.]|uniref:dihydropyrimidinase n=1 Tax=uncultured Dysosmobacter sp. TaxID=2591384 RepID=UPI002634853E|nr:dihydropyrimidinase [uncultured Dysosmobacter sp.]